MNGPPPNCNDGIECTVDSCDEQVNECRHVPANIACTDQLACNGQEVCVGGQCPAPVLCCDDGCETAIDHLVANVPMNARDSFSAGKIWVAK